MRLYDRRLRSAEFRAKVLAALPKTDESKRNTHDFDDDRSFLLIFKTYVFLFLVDVGF